MTQLQPLLLDETLAQGIRHPDDDTWSMLQQDLSDNPVIIGEIVTLVRETESGQVFIKTLDEFGGEDQKPLIPLEQAHYLPGRVLIDLSTMLSVEDYPNTGMLCKVARKTVGSTPNLCDLSYLLLNALTGADRDVPIPDYAPEITAAITKLNTAMQQARHKLDRTMMVSLRHLAQTLNEHLGSELAEAEQNYGRVSIPRTQSPRYSWIYSNVRQTNAYLSYFAHETVYSIRTVSCNRSVGNTYQLVGIDERSAQLRIGSLYAYNRPHDADVFAWELYRNNECILHLNRMENYPQAYQWSKERDQWHGKLPWE